MTEEFAREKVGGYGRCSPSGNSIAFTPNKVVGTFLGTIGCINLHRSPPGPWINALPKCTSVAVSDSCYPGYRNDPLRFRTQWSVAASNISSLLLCHTWRSATIKPLYNPRSLHRTIYFVFIRYPVRTPVPLMF